MIRDYLAHQAVDMAYGALDEPETIVTIGPGHDGVQAVAYGARPFPFREPEEIRPMSHRHPYGWSLRKHTETGDGTEAFEHEHERGTESHEHVLRDGGVEVKRTIWADERPADPPARRRPSVLREIPLTRKAKP